MNRNGLTPLDLTVVQSVSLFYQYIAASASLGDLRLHPTIREQSSSFWSQTSPCLYHIINDMISTRRGIRKAHINLILYTTYIIIDYMSWSQCGLCVHCVLSTKLSLWRRWLFHEYADVFLNGNSHLDVIVVGGSVLHQRILWIIHDQTYNWGSLSCSVVYTPFNNYKL